MGIHVHSIYKSAQQNVRIYTNFHAVEKTHTLNYSQCSYIIHNGYYYSQTLLYTETVKVQVITGPFDPS